MPETYARDLVVKAMAWLGYTADQALDQPMVWLVAALDEHQTDQVRLVAMMRGQPFEMTVAGYTQAQAEAAREEAEAKRAAANDRKLWDWLRKHAEKNQNAAAAEGQVTHD